MQGQLRNLTKWFWVVRSSTTWWNTAVPIKAFPVCSDSLLQRKSVEEAGGNVPNTVAPGFPLVAERQGGMCYLWSHCVSSLSMSPFKTQKCFLYMKENTLRKHTSSLNQVFLTVHILDPVCVPQHSCEWCTCQQIRSSQSELKGVLMHKWASGTNFRSYHRLVDTQELVTLW